MNTWGHHTLQFIDNVRFAIYLNHETLGEDKSEYIL